MKLYEKYLITEKRLDEAFYTVVIDNNLQKGRWVVGQGTTKKEALRKADNRLNGVHSSGIERLVVVKAKSNDEAREKAESGDIVKKFK